MTTNPIHTTHTAAITELQQLIEEARQAHRLFGARDLDAREVRSVIADALAAVAIAEVLRQIRPTCAQAWRYAACNPAASTPVEECRSVLALHAPRGLRALTIHSLHQVHRITMSIDTPGNVLAAEQVGQEVYRRRIEPEDVAVYHHA